MNIIGTGLSGLIGSRVVDLTKNSFSYEDLSLETGVDITKEDIVDLRIKNSDAPWVFHFAARTDVDGAESERTLAKEGSTWLVNVNATEHIAQTCALSGKRLLYISTDYVFNGADKIYTENDTPSPQGWYAITKYEGEKKVLALGDRGLVIRIANPYGAFEFSKKDFVHRIINRLELGETLLSPSDQKFIPTFIDDITAAIVRLVETNSSGIYHVVGSQVMSPYEAAIKVATTFGHDTGQIRKTTFREYFLGRAPRPFHAVLANDKIRSLGIKMSTFDEGILKVKSASVASQG